MMTLPRVLFAEGHKVLKYRPLHAMHFTSDSFLRHVGNSPALALASVSAIAKMAQ